MDVIRTENFIKQLKKVKDKGTRRRIFKKIKKITENPRVGKLLNYEKGIRKIYVPPFRLLYSYRRNKIFLLDFDHRDKIYKKYRKYMWWNYESKL